MNRAELTQAIPPVFTELVGKQLMAYLRDAPSVAGIDLAWPASAESRITPPRPNRKGEQQ